MLVRRQDALLCLCLGCVLTRSGATMSGAAPGGGAANDPAGAGAGSDAGPADKPRYSGQRDDGTGSDAGPAEKPRYSGQRDDGTGLPPLHHIGMVVRDSEKTLANLSSAMGFGPAYRFEGNFPEAILANGETGLALKGGFVWMRNTALEIVEPVDDRSPHAQFLKERGEGLHHMAYWVNSVKDEIAAMARGGVPPRLLVDGTGDPFVPWCYLEGDMAGSAIVELIERNEGSEAVYAEIFAAIGGKIPV